MRENYINQYTVALSAGINSSTTSIPVTAAASVSGGFRILIDAEWMLVTSGGTTTTWTVTRHIESSSADNHATGASIIVVLSAGSIDQIRADVNQVGVYASLPGSGMKAGDTYRCTDSYYTFVYDGSIWQPFVGEWPVILPPTSSWSWDNQGSATIDTARGSIYAVIPRAGTTSSRMYYRSAPATPYTVTALIDIDGSGLVLGDSSTGTDAGFGVGFRESSSGKLMWWYNGSSGGNSSFSNVDEWASSTSFSANLNATSVYMAASLALAKRLWFRLSDNGTNIAWQFSINGFDWLTRYSTARTTFFSSAPNQIGFGGYISGTTYRVNVLSWG